MNNAERERDIARMEAEMIHAESEYFNARPQLFRTIEKDRIFEAGFKAAWEARNHLTDPGYARVPADADRCQHGIRFPHPCRECEDAPITEENVAEYAYWCATEIIEPYVQRFERPSGELPASLVESVQFLLDHWLATKETSHD